MYGLRREIGLGKKYLYDYIRWLFIYRRSDLRKKSFGFENKTYEYFIHPYNHTWENERAVEIPVIERYMKQYDPRKIFDFGNVLSRYFKTEHTILDQYEWTFGKKIIKQDIKTFRTDKKYDLIVSISTLEHVGYDEVPSDPKKIESAVLNMTMMLDTGGKAVITVPVGYNKVLDEYIVRNRPKFAKFYCLL